MHTSFILVTELAPHHADWHRALAQAERLTGSLEPRLGIAPRVRLASLPPGPLARPVEGNEFFQTVRKEIGFSEVAEHLPIPQDLVERLV